MNWKDLFKRETVKKKEENKTTYTMEEEDRLREVKLIAQSRLQDAEIERDRQSMLQLAKMQSQSLLTNTPTPYQPTSLGMMGMATTVPGQNYSISAMPNQWSNTLWGNTTRDVNSLTDVEKAQLIANLMMREGLTDLDGKVAYLVRNIMAGRNSVDTTEKKQPKKKLDL